MKETVLGEAKLQAYYTLAYAYYLKAFAECTFLAARRQDITLAEDFDTEEDGQSYDQDFFRKKARTSLAKANRACWHARDLTGDLKKAIDFMLTQTNWSSKITKILPYTHFTLNSWTQNTNTHKFTYFL